MRDSKNNNPSLIEILRSKSNGAYLLQNLEKMKKIAEPILAKITETFPEYTVHDIRHSEAVMNILEWLIPLDLKRKLNNYEIYFLIASAYFHDIGMVDFPELLKDDFEQFREKELLRNPQMAQPEIKMKYIRERHHLRAEEFIVKHYRDLSMEDRFQAKIIGRICRGHRSSDLSDRSLFDNKEIYTSVPINVPLLSAFLQIADELDLTFARAPIIIYETIEPENPLSKEEWEKHLSIGGVGPDPDNPLQIIVSAECQNHRIHRSLKKLETRVQVMLDSLPNYLFRYRELISKLPHRIFIKIEQRGYKAYDLKFTLQEKEITDLLMGGKLYDRKEVCLRELLQNSVDACRTRKFLLEKRKLSYSPEIVFKITPNKDKIIVSDNGIGMDKHIVENYFTKIGKCFYREPEFLEKGLSFAPVSQFGIGIISCFMMADKITVETKADGHDSLLIEIDSIGDYFFVREGKRKEAGTTVILSLKEDVKDVGLGKEVMNYARHLEFPIRVISSDGSECLIRDQGFEPNMELLLSDPSKMNVKHYLENYGFHVTKINERDIGGIVGILFKKDENFGLIPPSKYFYGFLPKKIFISNEGIYVNEILDIFPEWVGEHLFVDLNLKNLILDLNVSRNNIVKNEKFNKFIQYIEKILISGIERWFNTLKRLSTDVQSDIVRNFFHEYLHWGVKKWSDAVLELAKRFYYLKCFSKEDIYHLHWSDVLNSGKLVVLLHNTPSEEYSRQVISNCSGFKQDELYVISHKDKEIANRLKDLERTFRMVRNNFLSRIEYEYMKKPKRIFPKTWKLVKFNNYKTIHIIEDFFAYPYITSLNAEHKFIKLLLEKGKVIISADRKMAIDSFFRNLKRNAKYHFEDLQKSQKEILKWFKDANLIENVDDFVLTKEEFPPHYQS